MQDIEGMISHMFHGMKSVLHIFYYYYDFTKSYTMRLLGMGDASVCLQEAFYAAKRS